MRVHFAGSLLLAYTLTGGSVCAQSLNRVDQRFLQLGIQDAMAQVKLAQLAQERGSSQVVRDFGARSEADQSKLNDGLKELASGNGITIPDTLRTKDQALYDRLSKLSGAPFDREYMRAMVLYQVLDVAAFRRESQSAADATVRDLATKTLPALEKNLTIARDDSAKLGISASK
jgi:putative membrane protein